MCVIYLYLQAQRNCCWFYMVTPPLKKPACYSLRICRQTIMVDRTLKSSKATNMWIFSQKLVELGWLYKQVRFEKFCMCSFCGSMKMVTIVVYGKYLVVSSLSLIKIFRSSRIYVIASFENSMKLTCLLINRTINRINRIILIRRKCGKFSADEKKNNKKN